MKTSTLIYFGQFLSSWGDRMWKFSIAMFLMNVEPESFQLIGYYGLVLASSMLLLGPLIGNWIDKSKRLYSVRLALVTQNSMVIACAVMFFVYNIYVNDCTGVCKAFVKVFSVILGTIALLASNATLIILQKDWIVIIAGENKNMLANLNAMIRRLDLTTKILAPLAVGQLMAVTSLQFVCVFIAVWNIVSMILEYALLKVVYSRTPELQIPKPWHVNDVQKENAITQSNPKDLSEEHEKENTVKPLLQDAQTMSPNNVSLKKEPTQTQDLIDETGNDNDFKNNSAGSTQTHVITVDVKDKEKALFETIFNFVFVIISGWKVYISQTVSKAGLGLSCLYLTVLGFDSITMAYAYNQCFSEFLVGIMVAAAGLTGILSTFLFPFMNKHLGLIKTGVVSSIAQLITLIPSVLSLFIPGGPFYSYPSTPTIFNSTFSVPRNYTIDSKYENSMFFKCLEGVEPPYSHLSLFVLLLSIILARSGLWLFDLSITQLFQETVVENKRGVVGGVQGSLNELMDLVHYVLIIIFSNPGQFGILVIISCVFVIIGHTLYFTFCCKYTPASN